MFKKTLRGKSLIIKKNLFYFQNAYIFKGDASSFQISSKLFKDLSTVVVYKCKKNTGGSKHNKNDSNKLYIKLKTKIED